MAIKQMPDNYNEASYSNLTIDGNTAYQTIYNVTGSGTNYKVVIIQFVKKQQHLLFNLPGTGKYI